ncbi:unnamed protein product [Linum trigynum]|uniref:DUF3615 domain-containing protein n=1 Tax=Linum trigynum TaxID=586398 RepID=A0AAV2CAQ8_9ROSI
MGDNLDLDAPDREPYQLEYWSDEERVSAEDPECQEILKNQTRSAAAVALESYYKREGVQYVLDEPLRSFCFLLDGVVVCHAIFTAKKVELVVSDDKDDSGSSSSSSGSSLSSPTTPASELFFAETAQVIGRDLVVTCCEIMNPSSEPDSVRDGCLYCGKRRDPVLYHPLGGKWKYGCQAAFKF